MKISAHCFAKNAKISPQFLNFRFREFDVEILSIENHSDKRNEKLSLKIVKPISENEFREFRIRPGKDVDPEIIFSSSIRKYEEALREAAHLVEGLLAILFGIAPPKFDTSYPTVNLFGESEEEVNFLNSDSITRGFGYASMPAQVPLYLLTETFKESVDAAALHLPALSFISQAKRSYQANDQEIAFFLYFRIIDGYFAFGDKGVEKALLSKEEELTKYLPYEENIIKATGDLLRELGLPSKGKENFSGLIKDIVLIRHKFTHFSARQAASHHSHKMFRELAIINAYLDNLCNLKLQDEMKIKFE